MLSSVKRTCGVQYLERHRVISSPRKVYLVRAGFGCIRDACWNWADFVDMKRSQLLKRRFMEPTAVSSRTNKVKFKYMYTAQLTLVLVTNKLEMFFFVIARACNVACE
jgi:hypothetical protein